MCAATDLKGLYFSDDFSTGRVARAAAVKSPARMVGVTLKTCAATDHDILYCRVEGWRGSPKDRPIRCSPFPLGVPH